MRRYFYHASPVENIDSILAYGLHAGTDGFVHLTTNQDIAIYCVHIRWYFYRRCSAIALFRVDSAGLCVQPCAEDALFFEDCYVHSGNIPKHKIAFLRTTQVARITLGSFDI